ncbi:MAG: DUF4352 domain-containing protein [Calditrichaceae bacterium]
MRSWIVFFLASSISFMLFGCGSNPEAEGDAAFASGEFDQARTHYLEVKKNQPENAKINEKIALTYMQKGLMLYKRTKNIDSFSGNFERGERLVPAGETSPEFKKQYSMLLFKFAEAYNKAKPTNEIQKEQYFTKMLENLEVALDNYPENQSADSLLSAVKQQNFKEMYEKGIKFFEQAKKEKTNGDLFLTAERYLARAVSFNPENKDAKKNLKLARQQTMSILDVTKDLPFSIVAMKKNGSLLLMDLTAVNNTGMSITFRPANLKLTDTEKNEYSIDITQTEKFQNGLMKEISIEPRNRIDGVCAFSIPNSASLEMLVYLMDDGRKSVKYLP